jgi:hypothetical protein
MRIHCVFWQAQQRGKQEVSDSYQKFFLIFLLFICAYNVWVISPLFLPPPNLPPHSLPYPTLPLATRQKLFCPYL